MIFFIFSVGLIKMNLYPEKQMHVGVLFFKDVNHCGEQQS